MYKIEKSLKLLGLENVHNPNKVLNEISIYLFGKNSGVNTQMLQRNFDLNLDYKYYFVDFLRLGINLNEKDVSWWEFQNILAGVLLDENSTISKVIAFRTYEKPPKNIKTQEEKKHKYRMEMKRKYALPNSQKISNGFEKMWNYVEKKVGENKE